ncbi:MAG: DUF1289 domain-containing protein [Nanoarchaeota archaeon]
MVKSPCINVCKLNENQICIGCYRSLDEIDNWSQLKDDEKIMVIEKAKQRRNEIRGTDYYGYP